MDSFRPQQGLTIMNYDISILEKSFKKRFRPQQGLTIMNALKKFKEEKENNVSVPNRG